MTNAEAIEVLRANYPDACYEQLREAVDIAIEALKAQLFHDGTTSDLISRQQTLNALMDAVKSVGVLDADDIKTVFDALPSVQHEKAQLSQEGTTKDAIDRQAAIDAADKVIERDKSGNNAVVNAMIAWSEYIRALPSAQPETNCSEFPNNSDTVSRQAAIDALQKCRKHCIDPFDSYHIDIQDAENQLSKVPTVQPERAEGEWIVHLYKVGVSRYECDACHARCDIIYPYCPYCGEKKEGERDATN